MKRISTLRFWSVLLAVLVAASAISLVSAQEVPDPTGFDQLLVYIGNGVYDASDAAYEMPTGEFFHQEIMGRSDEAMEQNRQDAIAFFETRFGIDATDSNNFGFMPFMFDPRNNYRARVASELSVPADGWVIRDGGWMLSVMNPDGVTLGGEFEGVTVPQGAMMVFGDYNIEVPDGEPIIIHYRSGEPIIANADGSIMFRCLLTSEAFGEGLAQGISAPQTLEDARTVANVRNVLTFPGLGHIDN